MLRPFLCAQSPVLFSDARFGFAIHQGRHEAFMSLFEADQIHRMAAIDGDEAATREAHDLDRDIRGLGVCTDRFGV